MSARQDGQLDGRPVSALGPCAPATRTVFNAVGISDPRHRVLWRKTGQLVRPGRPWQRRGQSGNEASGGRPWRRAHGHSVMNTSPSRTVTDKLKACPKTGLPTLAVWNTVLNHGQGRKLFSKKHRPASGGINSITKKASPWNPAIDCNLSTLVARQGGWRSSNVGQPDATLTDARADGARRIVFEPGGGDG